MKRKLPPVYVVVDKDGFVWTSSCAKQKKSCKRAMFNRCGCR